MRVLVTGATGFLGSHVTRALVARGADVTALVRRGSDPWRVADVLPRLEPQSARIDERCPPVPTTLYGAVKLSVSLLGRQLAAQAGMEFVWLRLFSSYGPMDDPGWLIPSVTLRLLGRERPDLTAGTQKWDYLFVEDAAGAVVEAATAPTLDGVFNLGSGRGVAV